MNKLVKVDNNIVVKEEKHLDELLKPFEEKILLFTTKIANTYKLKDKSPLLNLKQNEQLFFKLANSKYEDNVIEIYNSKNVLVGYIPEQDSIIFARLMNAGKKLGATIKSISQSYSVPLIEIDIYLIDY